MSTAAGIKPDYRLIVVPVRLKGSCGKRFYERIIDTINVDFIAPAILLCIERLLFLAELFSQKSHLLGNYFLRPTTFSVECQGVRAPELRIKNNL